MLWRKIRPYSMFKWPDVHRATPCQQARDQCHMRHAGRFDRTDCSGSWFQQEMIVPSRWKGQPYTTTIIMLPPLAVASSRFECARIVYGSIVVVLVGCPRLHYCRWLMNRCCQIVMVVSVQVMTEHSQQPLRTWCSHSSDANWNAPCRLQQWYIYIYCEPCEASRA